MDNCPLTYNPGQEDADSDFVPLETAADAGAGDAGADAGDPPLTGGRP